MLAQPEAIFIHGGDFHHHATNNHDTRKSITLHTCGFYGHFPPGTNTAPLILEQSLCDIGAQNLLPLGVTQTHTPPACSAVLFSPKRPIAFSNAFSASSLVFFEFSITLNCFT
jgi:hypothetical protein